MNGNYRDLNRRTNRRALDRELDGYMQKSARYNRAKLDEDMDKYMSGTKAYLDKQMDEYMSAKKKVRVKLIRVLSTFLEHCDSGNVTETNLLTDPISSKTAFSNRPTLSTVTANRVDIFHVLM